MVFYYYYDQLCKAINSSPHFTCEVTDSYNNIMCFIADRHHIYLQPRAQQGGDRHIGYYRMTWEDIEQVIKDQPELWVEAKENPKEKKEKEKDKEKGKGKVPLGDKRPSTIDIGNSLRKKRRSVKPTYHAVLHEYDFESIADRVYDNMSELITAITFVQEVLKQTIEAQLTELKMLVNHAPQVANPSTVQSAVMDPEGTQHRFISVTLINICQPCVQEGLQEGATQLDLAALPSKTLRTLQAQIVEEFNDKEQLVREENGVLKQEQDKAENKYRKIATVVTQWKQCEVSLKRVVVELCSELPDMQLELNASILENVQKVVVCSQALVVRMDVVEAEYKAKIEELEKRDPTKQLKLAAKEITRQIAHWIEDTTHLLETTTSSWLGIEQIDIV